MEADGALDEAVEVVLHAGHLMGLLFFVQVLMDAADAAGEGHRDGHGGFGHRVHGQPLEGELCHEPVQVFVPHIKSFLLRFPLII